MDCRPCKAGHSRKQDQTWRDDSKVRSLLVVQAVYPESLHEVCSRRSCKVLWCSHFKARSPTTKTLNIIKNMNRHGFQQAKVVYKVDEASGQTVGEPDYYVEGEETDEVEMKSLNQAIYKILVKSYGEETASLRYELYRQMVDGRGGFDNLEDWAESWDLPYQSSSTRLLTSRS